MNSGLSFSKRWAINHLAGYVRLNVQDQHQTSQLRDALRMAEEAANVDGYRWEYTRPLLAGWYWMQDKPEKSPIIVELKCEQSGKWYAIYNGRRLALNARKARWAGPLTTPNALAEWETKNG